MLPLLIAAAAPAIGNLLGNLFSGNDRKEAQRLLEEAQKDIESVGAGPDLSREIILNKFKSAGKLTPEVENAINIGTSKVADIKEDSSLRSAQTSALEALQQRGRAGLTPEDRAALNKVRNDVQRDAEAKRQQILQNAQARGMSGSGNELASQLIASQGGAEAASQQGDDIAAQASRNALEAMMQGGQLAGSIRGQDFDVNKARANAADEFKRFDVQNAIGRQTRNVGTLNDAQQYNLSNDQNLSNMNTSSANSELNRQRQAEEQEYQNALNYAQAKAGSKQAMANQKMGQAAQTQQGWSNIGSGVATGAAAIGTYQNNQANQKYQAQQNELNRQALSGTGAYAGKVVRNPASVPADEDVSNYDPYGAKRKMGY